MSEFLLDKQSKSSSNSGNIAMDDTLESEEFNKSNRSSLFEIDIVSDTLKHIHSKSKIRKTLSLILSGLYSYPILIISFSFFIGLLLFGVPIFFIFFNVIENIINPILFIIIFSLVFTLMIVIIRIIDDKKNNVNMAAKWERKNILKNLGLSYTLIILTISAFFMHSFFNDIINYKNNGQIKLIENNNEKENNKDDKNHIYDFVMRFIINCFLVEDSNLENKKIYIDNSIVIQLYKSLIISCIPLFIFCFNKIIKTIIIKVKCTFSHLLIFVGCFFLIILFFISYSFYEKVLSYSSIISIIEIILIGFITIGYIFWSIYDIFKLFTNPKDKNFAIGSYELCQIIFILLFHIINIIGSAIIFLSILVNFIIYMNDVENINNFYIIFLSLKIGCIILVFSNSYYYGHHLLSMIFRPISIQYAPAKLKKYCIKANRNLSPLLI